MFVREEKKENIQTGQDKTRPSFTSMVFPAVHVTRTQFESGIGQSHAACVETTSSAASSSSAVVRQRLAAVKTIKPGSLKKQDGNVRQNKSVHHTHQFVTMGSAAPITQLHFDPQGIKKQKNDTCNTAPITTQFNDVSQTHCSVTRARVLIDPRADATKEEEKERKPSTSKRNDRTNAARKQSTRKEANGSKQRTRIGRGWAEYGRRKVEKKNGCNDCGSPHRKAVCSPY